MNKSDNNEIIDKRIEIIHDSLTALSRVIGGAITKDGTPSPAEAAQALDAGLSLANALLVAITEMAGATADLSASVGKLVEIAERDYKIDVAMQAELKADENAKRSFIGQPRK